MERLALTDAIEFVRAAIDELQINDSNFGTPDDIDSQDLETIIKAKIVEAVTFVHKNAQLGLVGMDADMFAPPELAAIQPVDMGNNAKHLKIEWKMLRFVGFKALDSDIVVYSVVPEDSPEAIKQTNQYTRGTYERPVIVQRLSPSNIGTRPTIMIYYALRTSPEFDENGETTCKVEFVSYLPFPDIITYDNVQYIEICPKVELAILNYLTGLVLMVFKDEHANSFFNQAKLYM